MTNHYLNQWWHNSMTPPAIRMSQWVRLIPKCYILIDSLYSISPFILLIAVDVLCIKAILWNDIDHVLLIVAWKLSSIMRSMKEIFKSFSQANWTAIYIYKLMHLYVDILWLGLFHLQNFQMFHPWFAHVSVYKMLFDIFTISSQLQYIYITLKLIRNPLYNCNRTQHRNCIHVLWNILYSLICYQID